jgi:hypothetical protein
MSNAQCTATNFCTALASKTSTTRARRHGVRLSSDSLLLFGIERLTPGCRSFINCTGDFLVRDFATMLPKDRVVIEILETIQLDRQVVECCRSLKQAGYTLALDDFPLPLIRARFCELLGPCAGLADSANNPFLLGLLSAMDAILDMRMPDVREIAIRKDIRDALLGKVNPLRDIFELVLHYERGYWEEMGSAAVHLGVSEDAVPDSVLGIGGLGAADFVGTRPGTTEGSLSHTDAFLAQLPAADYAVFTPAPASALSLASITTSRATSSGSIAVLSTTTASGARTSGEVVRP